MKQNCVVGILFLTILMDIVLLGDCKTYKPLYWTPLNPLFNASVYRINVFMYAKLNIICPNPVNNPVTIELPLLKEYMFENIWSVDKTSFDTCVVNTTNKKNTLLFKCNDPLHLTYHTMMFLPTTNIEGQTEFEAGKNHYFIATSNGSEASLMNPAMGHCHTKNMRLIIYVCKDREDPLCIKNGPDNPIEPDDKLKGLDTETTHLPTNTDLDDDDDDAEAAASRGEECFISVKERIWLILVCVLSLLVLVLLLSNACLWRRSKKVSQATRADEKRANLI